MAGSRTVAACHLVVMAKKPLPGSVKTRLAAAVGDAEAAAVYERLLTGTLDQAERLDNVLLVLAEAPGPIPDERSRRQAHRFRPRWARLEQQGRSLGERLAGVFRDLFARGADRVVIVNSDSPPIPLEYLEQAFALLASDDGEPAGQVVVGPATDGGYYLIGVGSGTWTTHAATLETLLVVSPMSSPALLAHTLSTAHASGLRVTQLPLWVDIDEAPDLALMERLSDQTPLRGEPLTGLREIYLHLTHRCRRACRHCYDRTALQPARELTTTEWKGAIAQCVALGATSFVFIGGDPLLRPDFVDLVDTVTGAHAARARFFFNSHVDAALARELRLAGRGLLRPLVSIDGPREINDAIRGAGSYDDAMASVGNLLAVGLAPVANTVLVRPALPGLAQLARELRAAGLSRLHLILPHQQGGVPDDLDLVPSGEELLAALRELLDVADQIGLTVDNLPSWRRRVGKRNDFCAAGCRDLAIDPSGRVHACVITAGDPAFVAGSLRDQSLEDIWRTSSSLRLLRAAHVRDRAACRACPVVDACGGECWVQAHYAARAHRRPAGYTAPFPYCDLVRPMLEELGATAEPKAAAAGCVPGGGGQSAAGEDDYSLFDCI